MKCSTRTWRQWQVLAMLGLLLPALLALTGCAGSAEAHAQLTEASTAYQQRRYDTAYRTAAGLAGTSGDTGAQAAYLAGLAAEQLGRYQVARHYLQRAVRSRDESLASDALASLGLLHHRQGRYREAADALERAARQLTGEQRANAYFYAGIAQQKLDRWARARTAFMLARAATDDALLRQRIAQHLAVTGYTVQVGAFGERVNAQRTAEQYARLTRQLGLGPPRLVEGTSDAGRPLTFVQVGRFASYRAAQRARKQLRAQQSIVVPIMSR